MLIPTVMVLLAMLSPTQLATETGCNQQLEIIGLCTTNTGSEIIVDGSHTTPGDPGGTGTDPTDTAPISAQPGPGVSAPATPPQQSELDSCLTSWDDYIGCFRADPDADEELESEPEDPALPAVTISDLVRFAPDGTALRGEPDDLGIAGLPANFLASADAQTVSGRLFGLPVKVRFSPEAFDFDYGDGSTRTTTAGGRTWSELGQPQFTPTDTSHVYAERGAYQAHVDVRYAAELDLGIGWFPVPGQVTATGPDREIRIFEVHTALVAHTCAQAPSSPGC